MKKALPCLALAMALAATGTWPLKAQSEERDPLAHTFSIVARDPATGEMAVGVQSHYFSVGSIVSWGQSGVGVVATQSFVNPAFGPDGLWLMEGGKTAAEALDILIETDPGEAGRQVALLDAQGQVAAHTGSSCIRYAGHHVGENYAVQANMMLNEQVVPAMARAFEESSQLPLAERVVLAMQAGQEAGGDIRGKQSAALLVVAGEAAEHPSKDKRIDLRVEDHREPIKELGRLLSMHRAYRYVDQGDVAITAGRMEEALEAYAAAEALFPDNLEMKYWKAVGLANQQMMDEALPIFETVFSADEHWRELTRRLPDAGLLEVPEEDLERILELKTPSLESRGPEKGTLIIVGGGRVGKEIMDAFMEAAGGPDATIVVIPTATDDFYLDRPNAMQNIRKRFLDEGFNRVSVLHTRDPEEANSEEFVAAIREADGLWFTGGRQWRIADGFLHTRAHEEMFKLLERGGVIGGSSAGATIQGSFLARGDTRNNQIMAGDHQEGLGFLENVSIDQHVLARNRHFDSFDILKKHPHLLGLGIDESTAIVVRGNEFEVIGERYVLVYDGRFWSREGSALKDLPPQEGRFYFLQVGDRYDLLKRKVLD